MKAKILVIVGPTASGKTALAVDIARAYDGEVVSADSRQVYRGLNIGSGKVTKREMAGIRHHMLDIASPKKVYTASDFKKDGRAAIEDILKRGKLPIVCGGTGFYIDTLLGRVSLPDVPPNPKLRAQLSRKSVEELFALLQKKDPHRAANIDARNPVRLIRALEIVQKLGKVPMPRKNNEPYATEWIGIKPDNDVLRKKIHDRLLQRMKVGMLAEARTLHSKGLSYKRMHTLGLEYRYLALHLQGELSKEQMLVELENKIWDYAQSQMRYWKRNTEINWYTPESAREALDL